MIKQTSCSKPSSAAFILGSGFSKNAGLPTQKELSDALLTAPDGDELDLAITGILKTFLRDVFGCNAPECLPSLEDIFTCIDLSANAGHQLGDYDPGRLRAIRRMAIHRVLSVLNSKYERSPAIAALLVRAFERYSNVGFVVMNWDIVLENHLSDRYIDYCCEAKDLDGTGRGKRARVRVCKMHGSANWVYCERCKTLFFSQQGKLSLRTKAFLKEKDFPLFSDLLRDYHIDMGALPAALQQSQEECKLCHQTLSSHIATFSYRKSFRTHVYPSIWYEAEKLLANSDRWVFIGYSLPEADYEFKHLLKTAQLRRNGRKSEADAEQWIDVVYRGNDDTRLRFERFFGKGVLRLYAEGLEKYVRALSSQRTP